MGLLNLMGKKRELPMDIDLDMPPAPPKIGMEEETYREEPIDEELMPLNKKALKPRKIKAPKIEEELPEIPPLPEMEEPELPHLPEEEEQLPQLEDIELPPFPEDVPESKAKKKGLFSFLKPRKAVKEMPLPKEEFAGLPPLPELGEEKEFPELPTLEEDMGAASIGPFKEEMGEVPPRIETEVHINRPREPLRQVVENVKPKFVTITNFRDIQKEINNAKSSLKGIDLFFARLEEVKNVRDKAYKEWYDSLNDIHRKVMFVDKTLFEV